MVTLLVVLAGMWLGWVFWSCLRRKKIHDVLLVVMRDQEDGAEMFLRRVYSYAASQPNNLVPVFWDWGSGDNTARIIACMHRGRRQQVPAGCRWCMSASAGSVYLWDVRGMTPAELMSAPLPKWGAGPAVYRSSTP